MADVAGRRAKQRAAARIAAAAARPKQVPRLSNSAEPAAAAAAAAGAGPSTSAAGPAEWPCFQLPAAGAAVVKIELVDSLEELQAGLGALARSAQQQPQQEKDGGSGAATAGEQQAQQEGSSGAAASGGGGGGAAPAEHHVFDLGGQQLSGGKGEVLVVPPGVSATIRNGTLRFCVRVRGRSQICFEEVTFCARGGRRSAAAAGKQPSKRPRGNDAAAALVVAEEPGTVVALVDCDMEVQTEEAQHVTAGTKVQGQPVDTCADACVMARGGGHVSMRGSSLTGAASGLVVEAGSFAGALGTKAEGCAGAGFCATGEGTELQLYGCTARGNGGHGVACSGGSRAVLGTDGKAGACVLDGNGGCGLRVWDAGSVLKAGAETLVMSNREDGAGAFQGGRMTLDDRVVVRNNAKDGLVAAWGGKVSAGNHVHVHDNGKSGFSCCCKNSVMQLGNGATAHGNGEAGFISDDFGHMTVGQGALAEGNYNGFQAEGDAHLELGPGSVARGNRETGYLGLDHGELVVAAGGRAEKNGPKMEGRDGGSGAGGIGVHGSGARGSRAGGSGAGGSGDVGREEQGDGVQGAAAQEDTAESRGEGVAADGGTVVLKAGFVSQGNWLDGLVAENGGWLDASAGGVVSRGNGRHGVRSKGVGSVACVGAGGTVVEGNQGSGCMAKAGGVLRLGPGSGGLVRGNQERGLLAKGWVEEHREGGGRGPGGVQRSAGAGAGAGAAPGAEGPAGRVEGGQEWEVSGNAEGDREVVGTGLLTGREAWPFAAGELAAPRGRKKGRKGGKQRGKRRT